MIAFFTRHLDWIMGGIIGLVCIWFICMFFIDWSKKDD